MAFINFFHKNLFENDCSLTGKNTSGKISYMFFVLQKVVVEFFAAWKTPSVTLNA